MPVRSRSRASSRQEGAAVVVERAQFVEIGVEAGGDDAAVADQGRRFGQDGAACSRSSAATGVARCACSSASSGAALSPPAARAARQALQAVAQARQVARPGAVERDAAGDAFDVGKAAQACRAAHAAWPPSSSSMAIAAWRAAGMARVAQGWCRACRSSREPMR
jgi:hypothetical protein